MTGAPEELEVRVLGRCPSGSLRSDCVEQRGSGPRASSTGGNLIAAGAAGATWASLARRVADQVRSHRPLKPVMRRPAKRAIAGRRRKVVRLADRPPATARRDSPRLQRNAAADRQLDAAADRQRSPPVTRWTASTSAWRWCGPARRRRVPSMSKRMGAGAGWHGRGWHFMMAERGRAAQGVSAIIPVNERPS